MKKKYSADGSLLFAPCYITRDRHYMKEGEIMWRVCNSEGNWKGEPAKVIFCTETGYNDNDYYKYPYHKNHIHFYSKEKAEDYLTRFNSVPSVEELNFFIEFYKPNYCPCVLGKPFYPCDTCACGG